MSSVFLVKIHNNPSNMIKSKLNKNKVVIVLLKNLNHLKLRFFKSTNNQKNRRLQMHTTILRMKELSLAVKKYRNA